MPPEQHESLPDDELNPANGTTQDLIGCPYLGLFDDAETQLAFPNNANHCHRLQMPVGVDLTHQREYCLTRRFANCYVYGQPQRAMAVSKARQPAAVAVFAARLRDKWPAGLDRAAWRARLPRWSWSTSRQKAQEYLAAARQRLPRGADMGRLRELLPASLSLAALRAKWTSTWSKQSLPERILSRGDLDKLRARLMQVFSAGTLPAQVRAMNRRNLGLLAIPVFLVLVALVAIIWWPPPGEADPEALAMNAPVATLDGETIERPTAAVPAARDAEATVETTPTLPPAEQEAVTTARARGAQADEELGDAQGATAVSLDPAAMAEPAADSQTADAGITSSEFLAENGVAEVTESSGSPVENRATEPAESAVSTVPGDEAGSETTEEVPAGTDADGGEPEAPASAAAESEQPAGEEDALAAAADTVTTTISPLPAAAIASIGPLAGDGEALPLTIYRIPDDDAEVVSNLAERQPAAVLGRSSSSNWLLIRLGAGIEGWVRARESGADVVMSELPPINATSAAELSEPESMPAPSSAQPVEENLPVVSTAVVNTGALNLRSGPGIEYTPVGYVFNRQPVALLGQYGGENNVWVLVRTNDGQQGWMNSLYLIQTE